MNKKIIFVKDTDIRKDDRTNELYTRFFSKVTEHNIQDKIQIVRTSLLGVYKRGLSVKIWPGDITYSNISFDDIEEIIEKTIKNEEIINKFCYDAKVKPLRIVLKNCGKIDPENLNEYISVDGYAALSKVLFDLTKEELINQIKISGLRGRGGGGYPVWKKWSFAKEVEADTKYIICNGDEGDPGAYMDRAVLEGDPYAIIEGMTIAAYYIGASEGYLYIRAEYPLAIERVQKAIDKARAAGLLGDDIMESGFNFNLYVRLGAGAFVCGEETALMASMDGKRGTPSPRPPYPSVKGLWGKPTVINNVETLANISQIILKGGKWFSNIGTDKSKGTKVFALTGKIKNSGLIEVRMGTTLREIIFDIGGGIEENANIKAVQTGGPSGGVIPVHLLDTPVDYENLQKLGSIMGSGGMIVMAEDDCMVDIARFYLRFCVDESCGKCAPCRIGGFQMLDVLNKIAKSNGEAQDIDKLKRISEAMIKASLCGLGQTAPNPVLSSLKYFHDEYLEHIIDKKCNARKCIHLIEYSITSSICIRCGLCVKVCPVDAVSGDKETGFKINTEKCTKCGNCFDVCKFAAIEKG